MVTHILQAWLDRIQTSVPHPQIRTDPPCKNSPPFPQWLQHQASRQLQIQFFDVVFHGANVQSAG